MQDPPVGVASLGNHAVDRHPKHHHQKTLPSSSNGAAAVDAPVYREPSTYEIMVKCELQAGEPQAAARIVHMAEQRAFPPAGELFFLFLFLFLSFLFFSVLPLSMIVVDPSEGSTGMIDGTDPPPPLHVSVSSHRSVTTTLDRGRSCFPSLDFFSVFTFLSLSLVF